MGKKSYVHSENGKLLSGQKNAGRLVVMHSGFPTIKLINDAREKWETTIISTQRGKTPHMPSNHKDNLAAAKRFISGFSRSLHSNFITVTN